MPIEIDELSPLSRNRGGRGEKYPYDDWLDGKGRRFQQGEDFDGKPSSFITNVREAAKRRGQRIETRQGKDWAEIIQVGPYVGRKDKDKDEAKAEEGAQNPGF